MSLFIYNFVTFSGAAEVYDILVVFGTKIDNRMYCYTAWSILRPDVYLGSRRGRTLHLSWAVAGSAVSYRKDRTRLVDHDSRLALTAIMPHGILYPMTF